MTQKRKTCGLCLRPLKTCLCSLVVKIDTKTEVIIWQHPSEHLHPKGTAQLLNLCLNNSTLVLGEVLSPEELSIDLNSCVLLYPDNEESVHSKSPHPPSPKQLLIIDGTWRKSRKIIYCNPWLQKLPRLPIKPITGEYRIRKAEAGHQLSTFEACIKALVKLEGRQFKALDKTFDGFIEQYERFLPT